jgi:predicted RND superfamily exporter protein
MGLLSMLPLSVTIAFIYGFIGLVGKDYDMPVAVLSALTLGLSIDFAIHFLQRSRSLREKTGDWGIAVDEVFQEPARAISRNAIVISVGFLPLLFAPLVPYRTVGFFLATIMAVSWLATLLILAALVTVLQPILFKRNPGTDLNHE